MQDLIEKNSAAPIDKPYVSNSSLSEIKRILLGKPGFFGGEKYLLFGRELHSRDLERKSAGIKLESDEEKRMQAMLRKLDEHKFYQQLKRGSLFEHKKFGKLFTVQVKTILDVYKKGKHIADLKTTTCDNEEHFIRKAVEYDYFRQGWIYEKVGGVKDVFFVGIQKWEPYNVYILHTSDFKELRREAALETEFLIYYFKTYGFPKPFES